MGLVLWDVRELRDPPELPEFFGERRCSGADVCGPALVPPPRKSNGGGVCLVARSTPTNDPRGYSVVTQVSVESHSESPTSA
jgi:hypothetical protein